MHPHDKRRRLLGLVRNCRPGWIARGGRLDTGKTYRAVHAHTESAPEAAALTAEMADLTERLTEATPPEALTDRDTLVLEAIVHTELRPAVLVQDGQFLPMPEEWAHLEGHRAAIEHALARTGRIEAEGDIDLDWVGTGFVIAEDLVATNRHVVETFASHDPVHGWHIREGVGVRVDFAEEIGGLQTREVAVTGIWGVHTHFDIAVLQMAPGGCPSPLPHAAQPARAGADVVALGYPAFDSRRNDAEVMQRIFRGIYNVKRVLPGRILSRELALYTLRHDASTLGGSSGSPVIDPATGAVVGIHFGGRYLMWNEAVDLTPRPTPSSGGS
ncbi:trypsin-like serine peptidase [Futiania mangrovi]|uniref:Serine protease n=1 Tax=Futiania mangrovi TaxID=2959716 RepID=A0A9J6PIX4_9PROT|nr:serine protease [Futiania mangrovii]MCP1337739.1 serine protease [Futiania mangrovii]